MRPSSSTTTLLKKFDVGDDVRETQPMLGEFDEKVIAGVSIEVVAVLLIVVLAKLGSDHRRGNMSAKRIMPPKAVRNNGYQSVPHISHQDMAARQLCRV